MEKKPNILIIITDQQRHNAPVINNRIIQTPSLDRFTFEDCILSVLISPDPICIPARHNMLSGLTCRYHGFDGNDFSQIRSISYYLPIFPQILNNAVYHAIVSVQHRQKNY